ncbi:MAG: hypothetical protein ACPG31_02035 [Planctomycetota bacterium]
MLALVSLFLTVVAQNPSPAAQESVDHLEVGAWRLLGPLPKAQGAERRRVQTAAKKMLVGVPWKELGATHEGPEGMQVPWIEPDVAAHLADQDAASINPRERLLLDSGRLDLAELLPLLRANPDWGDGATAFLYLPVYANAEGVQPVHVGGLGAISLWWNGKRVLVDKTHRVFKPTAHRLDLDVQPGLNHLLVQVEAKTAGWSFEMQSIRRISNPRIHRAIDLGVEYLLDRQAIDGSWPAYPNYTNGSSALAIYTLVKSGVSPRHESVLKGLAHLRKQRATQTYAVALELMAYNAGGDPQDRPRMEELAADLVDWQMANGLWGYGEQTSGWSGDLSNAQYAALGLRAASASGITIPQTTWRKLARGTLNCSQQKASNRPTTGGATPVGFAYFIGGGDAGASMSAAGVGTLAICRSHFDMTTDTTLKKKVDQGIASGIAWLGHNWGLGNGTPEVWNFYYLYGLERAGGLADTEMFGDHAWYWEGAAEIVGLQLDTGAWNDEPQPISDCFALLFLRRATGNHAVTNVTRGNPSMIETEGDLRMRLSLRPPVSLWIDSTTPGFEDIVRVVYWLKPPVGDWVRIEEFQERRFAIQPQLDMPGTWTLRADAVQAGDAMLSSGTIEFEQKDGASPERLAYVDEGEWNLGQAGRPSARVSSSLPRHAPDNLTDGNPNTSWFCDPEDEEPSCDVRFGRTPKASSLKLVLAPVAHDAEERMPRIQQLQVRVNERPAEILTLSGDLKQKITLEFDNPIRVSRVRIKVLDLDRGRLGEDASVGFAEVELYNQ